MKGIEKFDIKDLRNRCNQLLVFSLGNRDYAFPIEQVRGVEHSTDVISNDPYKTDNIKDATNITGKIISVLDFELKFTISQKEQDISVKFLISIESDIFITSILVKTLPHILTVDIENIEKLNDVLDLSTFEEQIIFGVVEHENKMIFLVDIIKILEIKFLKPSYNHLVN